MKNSLANMDGHVADAPQDEHDMPCNRCGGGPLTEDEIKTAFWVDDRLVVVQGIPAMVCTTCGEEYVSDHTAVRLDQIKASRGRGTADAEMTVPVFNFGTLPEPGS